MGYALKPNLRNSCNVVPVVTVVMVLAVMTVENGCGSLGGHVVVAVVVALAVVTVVTVGNWVDKKCINLYWVLLDEIQNG